MRTLAEIVHDLGNALQAHLDLPHAIHHAMAEGGAIVSDALEAEPRVRALLRELSALAHPERSE